MEHELDETREERVAALYRIATRCAEALLVVERKASHVWYRDEKPDRDWVSEKAREQSH